ncbi:hypothetical protein ACLMJV_32875, partial [Sinorhizobium meliloti]|uniref:hypothetical protein n=1 Tax=Rhizobium meliloti TaxID=382 RepID=UPI00398D23E6
NQFHGTRIVDTHYPLKEKRSNKRQPGCEEDSIAAANQRHNQDCRDEREEKKAITNWFGQCQSQRKNARRGYRSDNIGYDPTASPPDEQLSQPSPLNNAS